jgi:hypothetical protein
MQQAKVGGGKDRGTSVEEGSISRTAASVAKMCSVEGGAAVGLRWPCRSGGRRGI